MKSGSAQFRSYEFCFIELDYTLVRVEDHDGDVIIRASDDTFTRRRKANFVHELAAEGFIPDEFKWFTPDGPALCSHRLDWRIDGSWMKVDTALITRHWRVMRRLFLPATLMWLAFVYLIYPGAAKPPAALAVEHSVVAAPAPSAH